MSWNEWDELLEKEKLPKKLKVEVQLLRTWRDKTRSLQNENLMAQSNIQVLTEAKVELTNQIKTLTDTYTHQISELQQTHAHHIQESSSLKMQLAEKISEKNQEIKQYQDQNQTFQEQIDQLQEEYNRQATDIQNYTDQLRTAQNLLDQTKSQWAMHSQSLQQQVDALSKELLDKNAIVQNLQDQMQLLQEQSQIHHNTLATAEDSLHRLEEELRQKNSLIEQLEQQISLQKPGEEIITASPPQGIAETLQKENEIKVGSKKDFAMLHQNLETELEMQKKAAEDVIVLKDKEISKLKADFVTLQTQSESDQSMITQLIQEKAQLSQDFGNIKNKFTILNDEFTAIQEKQHATAETLISLQTELDAYRNNAVVKEDYESLLKQYQELDIKFQALQTSHAQLIEQLQLEKNGKEQGELEAHAVMKPTVIKESVFAEESSFLSPIPLPSSQPESLPGGESDLSDSSGQATQRVVCPRCGNMKVKSMEDKSIVLSYFPSPVYGRKNLCVKCGFIF